MNYVIILKHFSINMCQGYIYKCTSSAQLQWLLKKKKAVADLVIASFS